MRKHKKLLALCMVAAMIVGTVNVAVANKTDEADRKTQTVATVDLEEEKEESGEAEKESTEASEESKKDTDLTETEESSTEETEESSEEETTPEASEEAESTEASEEEESESTESEEDEEESTGAESTKTETVTEEVKRVPMKIQKAELTEAANTDLETLFAEAIENDERTLRLEKGITYTVDNSLTVPEGKSLNLVLNGANIDYTGDGTLFLVYGTMVVTGSSDNGGNMISGIESGSDAAFQVGNYVNKNVPGSFLTKGASLTLRNVKVSNVAYGVDVFGENTKLVITGDNSEIEALYYAVSTNGSNTSNPTITIDGGTLRSNEDVCMYMPAGGAKITVNNGEISGFRNAIQLCGGSLTINGGTLSADASDAISADGMYVDGSVWDGAAVSFISRKGYAGQRETNNSIIIKDGTFIGGSNPALRLHGGDKNKEDKWTENKEIQFLETLEISGGEFINEENGAAVEILNNDMPKIMKIEGGAYSAELDAKYVPDGYTCKEIDGMYYIVSNEADTEADVAAPEANYDEVTGGTEDTTISREEIIDYVGQTVDEFISNEEVTKEDAVSGLKEALGEKASELIPEEVKEDGTLEIKMNIAFKEMSVEKPEDAVKAKKLVFEVHPVYSVKVGSEYFGQTDKKLDNQYLNKKEITFRLPIPSSVTERYAKVTHEGVRYYEIQGAGASKYIEVKAKSFSEFVVEFTNTKPSSGGGSVSGAGVYYADGRGAYEPTSTSNGTWKQDASGWQFTKTDGSMAKNEWYSCEWNKATSWYHFNEQGYMQDGWFTDVDGRTYFLHNVSDNTRGRMYTGWNWIGGKCYFFETQSGNYLGHLYKNCQTPDGNTVNENGEWTVNGVVQTR